MHAAEFLDKTKTTIHIYFRTFWISAHALMRRKKITACLVFDSSWTLSETTIGNSGIWSITCPLLITKAGTPVAATAEAKAYRRWLTLTRLCQRRHGLVGANMRPPLHMLPKAPWPERWVPPPRTRGIRATARPVPHDSAEVWWPGDQNAVRILICPMFDEGMLIRVLFFVIRNNEYFISHRFSETRTIFESSWIFKYLYM